MQVRLPRPASFLLALVSSQSAAFTANCFLDKIYTYIYIYAVRIVMCTRRMRNRRSLGKTEKKSADWCTRCVQRTRSTLCIVRDAIIIVPHILPQESGKLIRSASIGQSFLSLPTSGRSRELSILEIHYGRCIFDGAIHKDVISADRFITCGLYVNYTASVSLLDQSLVFSLVNLKSLSFTARVN